MMNEHNSLYCDCCQREKMAELRGSKLVITDRRHGQKHVLVLDIDKLRAEAHDMADNRVTA